MNEVWFFYTVNLMGGRSLEASLPVFHSLAAQKKEKRIHYSLNTYPRIF